MNAPSFLNRSRKHGVEPTFLSVWVQLCGAKLNPLTVIFSVRLVQFQDSGEDFGSGLVRHPGRESTSKLEGLESYVITINETSVHANLASAPPSHNYSCTWKAGA